MKTLVFHSVKGGVGRTLALCNVAKALSVLGKRVLMLDFDYSAPGLHHKWGKKPRQGYIEYLEQFCIDDRAKGRIKRKRWNYLERCIERVDDNLYLLRAGDETSPNYWRLLSSHRFHRLFYVAQKEINGLNAQTFPIRWLDLNSEAFEQDKKLIEKRFNPDYLLVDCKTCTETSAFILLSWADTIAHFFPPNLEGCLSVYSTACGVVRSMAVQQRQIGIVPVVARVPDKQNGKQHTQHVLDIWQAKQWPSTEQPYADKLFQERDFVCLSEMRGIEGEERILFEMQDPRRDALWQLSHDYLSLCARLAPPDGTNLVDAESWWHEKRGVSPDTRILPKHFDRYPHLGTMLNVDEQPNIAMRVKTFHLLLGGLLAELEPKKQQAALLRAGHSCGKDFATDLNSTFAEENIDKSLRKRIEMWAEFDSGVGFGALHPLEVTDYPLKVWLLVMGDAFTQHQGLFREEECRDLRGFFDGYIEGVIGGILQTVLANASIKVEVQTVIENVLPPKILKIGETFLECGEGESKIYYSVQIAELAES